MKITISLKEKHLEDFLKQNELLKDVIDRLREHKSYHVQICTQNYAIDCERERKNLFIRFIGDGE